VIYTASLKSASSAPAEPQRDFRDTEGRVPVASFGDWSSRSFEAKVKKTRIEMVVRKERRRRTTSIMYLAGFFVDCVGSGLVLVVESREEISGVDEGESRGVG